MTAMKISKTTWTTILGIAQAGGTAAVDYLVHAPMEGGATEQPTFWLGLGVAALMAIKGYLTQGTDTDPVATKPAEPPKA